MAVCTLETDSIPKRLSVHQTDADTEQILVDVGKVGDVIGIFSPGVTLYLFIGFLGNLF